MSLLNLDEILAPKKESKMQFDGCIIELGKNTYINSAFDYLSKYRNKIDFSKTNHLVSNGRYAMHDLTGWIARELGQAEVIRLTYAISTDAARLYVRLFNKGIISNLIYIIDKTAKTRNADAIKIMNPFQAKFTENHTKIALITNGEKYITVKGSGNDTQGNRKEDFTIFTDIETYEFYRDITNEIINKTA